jgi:outer membrane protein OmpA-like peptidoglycan-associated protein
MGTAMFLRRFIIAIYFVGIFIPSLSIGADCEKAKEYFDKALKMDISSSELIQKGLLYKKAVEICPGYAEAHNNLGDVYERQRRFEEAISEYKKAVDLKPERPLPYFGLGDVYLKAGYAQEAVHWYERGLLYDPKDSLTLSHLSLARSILNQDVIKGDTIRDVLTRGVGGIKTMTFGERLIPFDFDRYDIRPDARPQLNEIGKALQALLTDNDSFVFNIAGHTDMRGTDEYNLDLSNKRAESVIDYLSSNFNIPLGRLRPVGYGERRQLCTSDDSEPCHALNRRVEITRNYNSEESVRSIGVNEPKVVMDLGVFYQNKEAKLIGRLKEDITLNTDSDGYCIFFRPHQDLYVYVLQENEQGEARLIFPDKDNNAFIVKDNDYWLPEKGKDFIMDKSTGEGTIYFIVSARELKPEIEGLSLTEQVTESLHALKTIAIRITKNSSLEQISVNQLAKEPKKIEELMERVEGEGGWVRGIRLSNEKK